MSKLYTEEQVRNMLNGILLLSSSVDDAINSLIPIQLPTDEEIERKSKHWGLASDFFYKGAKWMRDKIKGGEQ